MASYNRQIKRQTVAITRPDPLRLISYAEAREAIQTGDVGLFAGDGPASRIIKRATDSPYCHALMLGWQLVGAVATIDGRLPEAREAFLAGSACLSAIVFALTAALPCWEPP